MAGDVGYNQVESADLKRSVFRDCQVMLTITNGRQSNVTSCLARDLVTEPGKQTGKSIPIDVSVNSHTAMTSSFTQ